MTGSILWLVCVCAVGLIFFAISSYAEKKKTPMWFITGGYISPDIISDVKEFNKENATMWRNYSVIYFASGVLHFIDKPTAMMVLLFACTGGIVWLFWKHSKIMQKYKCDPPKKIPKKKKR